MRRDLPRGTVTFLFTDVEASTKLLHELGTEGYAHALAEHRRVLRDAFTRHAGVEVDTQGDAFFVAFPDPRGALDAARDAVEGLAATPIRVRMGIHTGRPHVAEEGYVGIDVHRAARIAAAGHGGQVLVSAATAQLLRRNNFSLLDLGEHRLKDFAEPVSLYQLGPGDFPPLKTISNTNLPRPASTFVGRDKEVDELTSLLREGARLLTLTGPGGTGKTRLAVEAASELVPEFKAGVFWIGLAAVREPALVPETIAQTLGAKNGLAAHIGERELLLLLDNFEQVVDAAPELAALLESCPNLRLLVTSRELLRVRGEVEYPVLPLAEAAAIQLFCTRSRLEADHTIAALCRALENLPLALELAAARTSVLSPAQVLERLVHRLDLLKGGRDADPRQQTLRATIEWSYDLLSAEERRLFARLAVFRGGCTLAAAAEVAGANVDTLQSLVGKSLLRHTNERFGMLETIREYAAERLGESGEANELRGRHAEHFLAFAEDALPQTWEGNPATLLDRIDAEHDNFRVALDHLEASNDTQRVLRLTGVLWRFWNLRGHLAEGMRRLERALAADERRTPARAKALIGVAAMAALTGDAVTARFRAEEALAVNRALGDARGSVLSQSYIATAATGQRDWAAAREISEETVRLYRQLGDEDTASLATWQLAWICREQGDRERANALLEDNLQRAQGRRNKRVEAMSLDALAMLAIDDARLADALALLKDACDIHRELGDTLKVALCLCRFARARVVEGSATIAARLLAKGEALREETGARLDSYVVIESNLQETLAAVRRQLDEKAFTQAWKEGRALTVDEALTLALDVG